MSDREETGLSDIAVVGMAGRFAGAGSVEELWRILERGIEAISVFTQEELEAAGVPSRVRSQPSYVPARGVLEGAELFDASLFGISPREARVLDPQQRLFLEEAWAALENAACDPGRFPGAIGVYAGCTQSSYALRNLLGNPEVSGSIAPMEVKLGNDRDFLATATSYRLDLRGPSVNVATACSTSLVAVHLACQALLNRECDLALAGGVSVAFPQRSGYLYQRDGILAADGHCRAFDAAATGSVAGDGVGVVVLKRLEDALRDRDPVRAVIRGSALNNDGSHKIGFTAPGVEGQAAVIAEALALAGLDADSISYVETHGSGTPLGDPVEVRALTRAFRASTERTGYCALGSIKTNIGHTDAAAGVAGLIKTVLALEQRKIPPSLHFEKPNPEVRFAETPFYVASRLAPWNPRDGEPRRAGVSSFGIGGTNAHVVVEEAPPRKASGPSRPWQLLVLSAAAPEALETATDRLTAHLEEHPDGSLADVAFTLQTGRRALRYRRGLVCRDREDAARALRERAPRRLLTGDCGGTGRPVAFLLPGVGDHYPGMTRGLYESEKPFRQEIDRCAEVLQPLGIDLREALFAGRVDDGAAGPDLRRMLGREREAGGPLDRTEVLHPAVFAVEVALARLWESWGVRPRALLGYSLGEYAAACLAGVFSLEDGLRLVAERARRIAGLQPGGMLAVALPEEQLRGLLGDGLSLAAVNAPELCVAAGPEEALAGLERQLAGEGISVRRLPVGHALHSAGMEPLVEGFEAFLRTIPLHPPKVPYVTNVTGDWITPGQATDPAHWARHLRATVRFEEGLRTLWAEPSLALLEVGPGHGLTTLALQQGGPGRIAVPSLPPAYDRQEDGAFLLTAAARLWLEGVDLEWASLHAGERRNRLALPTYPFQRQRYFVEPRLPAAVAATTGPTLGPGAPSPEEPPAAAPAYARPGLRTAYVEPRDSTEVAVAAVWQEVLGLERVGVHDSFFELGGHSLLAPRILLRVQEETGVEVPLPRLLEAPTVAALSEAVERLRQGGTDALPAPERPDLRAEVALTPEIWPESGPAEAVSDPEAVLLTGATGFLGAFLLRDLLEQTRATVHCLVRAASPEEGRERIRRNLERHGIDPEMGPGGGAARIVPVPGDLAAPRWGLDEATFGDLSERVEAVYHAGAWVNFTYPYRVLKPANVAGSEQALRLAAAGRAKPVHFVSSVSVFAAGSFTADRLGLEGSDLPAFEGLFGGYPQTKWVAEKLFALGRVRGIRSAIYRPGLISGDTRTGIGNPRDLVWSFLKACLQMGAAPDLEAAFDPVPVDYVSRALVHLSRRPGSLGRAFHFFNPRPLPWREVFAFAREWGHPVRIVRPAEWDRELARAVRSDPDNALAPFWPLVGRRVRPEAAEEPAPVMEQETEREAERLRPEAVWRLDDRNTREGLAGSGIECPPVDARLLATYFEFFTESGFFPSVEAPRERASR